MDVGGIDVCTVDAGVFDDVSNVLVTNAASVMPFERNIWVWRCTLKPETCCFVMMRIITIAIMIVKNNNNSSSGRQIVSIFYLLCGNAVM